MTELKNEMESPQDEQRKKDGKAGKLWTIAVIARHGIWGQETRRFARCNLYWNELGQARSTMCVHGIMMPVDPGHWIVILPWDILQIDIDKQKTFFENEPFR